METNADWSPYAGWELAGFARALQSVDLGKPEMELLSGALEAKLDALPANYRSFAMKLDDLADALDFFAARAKGRARRQLRCPHRVTDGRR